MKNFVKSGHVVTVPAPADLLSGDLVFAGSLVGVAEGSALAGADVEVRCGGVYDLPKVSAQAWTFGVALYWDATAKAVTSTVDTNTKIGVAVAVAANPSATGRVRLNGSF